MGKGYCRESASLGIMRFLVHGRHGLIGRPAGGAQFEKTRRLRLAVADHADAYLGVLVATTLRLSRAAGAQQQRHTNAQSR